MYVFGLFCSISGLCLHQNVLCLAREVDLVTSWNPAISDMQELGSYSPAELLVRSDMLKHVAVRSALHL